MKFLADTGRDVSCIPPPNDKRLTLYYRRHLKRLKEELAYEKYAADPNQSLDRRHFDNPVYTYLGVPPPSTSLSNTGTKHIYDDLGMKRNLSKTKLGVEDSETYACTELF
ncbi:hypothetical protein NPIL_315551 [Nephila pilipes]|uniref:Uncharacterized protein n=1 Tax=Nephila pilipes TaxID=299642 RepID=A0A8X6N1U4_NEPPI|nr:hypothetical protein NPIL_315551 [Nephila pilipes]